MVVGKDVKYNIFLCRFLLLYYILIHLYCTYITYIFKITFPYTIWWSYVHIDHQKVLPPDTWLNYLNTPFLELLSDRIELWEIIKNHQHYFIILLSLLFFSFINTKRSALIIILCIHILLILSWRSWRMYCNPFEKTSSISISI